MDSGTQLVDDFTAVAQAVGAQVIPCDNLAEAIRAITEQVRGVLLCPGFASGQRTGLADALRKAGCAVVVEDFRKHAASAYGGVTGVNFALADTGSLVLESTPEDIRLATTLPEVHFALLDPQKILADGLAAVPHLRQLHQRDPRNYIAYITGPSRTADIERVLTIGVHGPMQLFILLVPGLSNDLLEM